MELILNSNNLYRNAEAIQFANGQGLLVRTPLELVGNTEDKYHTVLEDDRIDLIAHKYYSSRIAHGSKFWWIIADANNIENPLDLSSFLGQRILIPEILNTLLKLQE